MPRGDRLSLLPRTVRGILLLLLLVVLVPMLLVQAGIFSTHYQERRAQEFEANLEVARAVAVAFDAYVQDVSRQEFSIGLAAAQHSPPRTPQTLRG